MTSSPAHARPSARPRLDRAALLAGTAVAVLTVAGQVGLLGGHDLTVIALLGLAGAGFCLAGAIASRTRSALLGLVLSLLPVALLAYYLTTSGG